MQAVVSTVINQYNHLLANRPEWAWKIEVAVEVEK
jgi:hypothetical protein